MEKRFCGSTGMGREWKCCLLHGCQWHIDVSTLGDSVHPLMNLCVHHEAATDYREPMVIRGPGQTFCLG